MTEPSAREESAPAPPTSPEPPPPRYLGLTTFTIEGRRAPALFVVGWLATLVGVGLTATVAFGISGLGGLVLSLASLLALSIGLVSLAGSQTIERRAAGAAYAGPSPLLVLLAVLPISHLVAFVVGVPLLALADRIPVPLGDLLAAVIQAVVTFGVLRLLVVGAGVMRWSEMGWVGARAEAIRGLIGGAVFASLLVLATALLARLAVSLVGVAPPSPLPPTGTGAGLAFNLVTGAIVAPIAEEGLFRGFALSAWRRVRGTRDAIVRTSIVFVLAHVLFISGDTFADTLKLALVAGVVRIPIAIALGWLFVRTGTIWGPIGLHAAFNAILIVASELGGPG